MKNAELYNVFIGLQNYTLSVSFGMELSYIASQTCEINSITIEFMLCQDEGGIGLSMLEIQEISLGHCYQNHDNAIVNQSAPFI